jgi:surface antigen
MRSTHLIAALVPLLVALPAFAFNELFAKGSAVSKLNDEDIRIASAAVNAALDGNADGEVREWRNPATQANGTVKPTSSSNVGGKPCRKMEFTTNAGGQSGSSRWLVCKTKEGWKIASGA